MTKLAMDRYRWTLFLSLLFLLPFFSHGQDTLVLQPGSAEGKDASLKSLKPNTNYGTRIYFDGMQWTGGGTPYEMRSVIEFDLTDIPANATVVDAELKLFGDGHDPLSYPNEAYLKRVEQEWKEDSVTWNNRPTTDTTGQVHIPTSNSSDQDYLVDVTDHVQDFVSDSTVNHGLMLELITDDHYSKLRFASSDHSDSTHHPRLEVIYSTPPLEVDVDIDHASDSNASDGAIDLTLSGELEPVTYDWSTKGDTTQDIDNLTVGVYYVKVTDDLGREERLTIPVASEFGSVQLKIAPDSVFGKDTRLKEKTPDDNKGDQVYFDAMEWIGDGTPYEMRGLIEFDLAGLDSLATGVKGATLELTASGHYSDISNACYLRKVTEPWEEFKVTWNNQPDTDTTDQVYLPASDSSDQPYSVDVTHFFQDFVSNPSSNHGLMIDMIADQEYEKLRFYSSDAQNISNFPVIIIDIVITYDQDHYATLGKELDGGYYEMIEDELLFRFDGEYGRSTGGSLRYRIYDESRDLEYSSDQGLSLVKRIGYNQYELDISSSGSFSLSSGFYVLEVFNEKDEKYQLKFKKQGP